jgi:hypothetical protein
MVLEVAYFTKDIQKEDVGKFQRENADIMLLAWLMSYAEAKSSKDEERIAKFQSAAQNVGTRFNLRATETEKRIMAYQFREDEDKVGERLGHSPILKAKTLYTLQERTLRQLCAPTQRG